MADDDWDDEPLAPAEKSNSIGFGIPGAGRGFKPASSNDSNGFEDRKPGGGEFGGESRGFGGESKGFGGGSKGFGGESKGFGGESKGFGGESKGFGGESKGFGGGSKGFGGESKGFGGGSKGFGGGGGRGSWGGDNQDGDNRRGEGGYRGGRGGGYGNRNNENDGDSGGGYRAGRGGGRGGGYGSRRNDDGEDGGDSGRGFGGNRGFNSGDGGGGGRGGYGRRNDDGEDGGDGNRGFGGGGRGRGRGGGGSFGRQNDDGENGGGGRGFGRRNDDGDDGDRGNRARGFGGDRGTGEGGDQEKPREIYVPKQRNEDELYDDGTRAGINFSKYDSIEVKTTGEDIPNPITSFDEVSLRDLLRDNIKRCNYTVPTPVQKYSLPIVLGGRDMMACAQTGSGKTAAFMIPIIQKLLEKSREIENMRDAKCVEPRAIIIAPTRELAIQTHDVAVKFAKGSILHCRVCYGGTSLSYELKQLFNGCDILVATTGRLKGFVGMGKISFASVEFVVLDEADRMLDGGFIDDAEMILRHDTMTPVGERQTLMFSATFPTAIQQLAGKYMQNYVFVAVGIVGGACTDIEQNFMEVNKKEKRSKLKELLEIELNNNTLKGILVFVGQKKTADFVAALLSEAKFPTTSIHGDRQQREREEALNDFKSGRKPILVATAVAARGLDISCARHVINYDLPNEIDEYIHRIGRTGRVGNKGKATSFYDEQFDGGLKNDLIKILSQAGQPVPDWLEGGGGRNFGPASSFGGQDIRSFSDVQDASRGAAQAVEEAEEWD